MAQYYPQQAKGETYPPPPSATQGPYVTPPPPMGYPAKYEPMETTPYHQTQTQSKGLGGCLQGCLAALCCCWVLDCVF